MLLVSPVKKELCYEMTNNQKLFGIDKLNIVRSSCQLLPMLIILQEFHSTVSIKTNPRYYKLINAFHSTLAVLPLLILLLM